VQISNTASSVTFSAAFARIKPGDTQPVTII